MKALSNTFLFAILLYLSGCGGYHEELAKIPEYMELSKTIAHMPQFKNFPPMDSWLFLIDGKGHGDGPWVFDKEEPGYLAGMAQGMNFALKNYQQKLSVEFFEELRKTTTAPVKKQNDTEFREKIGGNATRYNLILSSNATKEGIEELKNKLAHDPLRKIVNNRDGVPGLERAYVERDILYPRVQKIIDDYENSPKIIKDIARLCQDLDQLHPFNDGNVRTFVEILSQKELLRNGYKPVILYDPNRFDAFSLNQVVVEILDGQREFSRHLINISPDDQ